MNQKQRTLALLGGAVVVAAGLGGLVYKLDRDEDTKKAADEKSSQLVTFDSTKVDWVKVSAKGQLTELRKTGTTWEITEPLHAAVDVGVLDGLVGRLSELKTKSKVEDSATDLTKYGLDKPRIEVWAKGAGIEVDVQLGDDNGFNYSEYVKRGGDQAVYLAEGGNAALEKTTFDLRDKHVLSFETSAVTALQVKGPDGDYSLVKTGEGWRLTTPTEERADDTVVGQLLATLSGLKAIAIPEEKAASLNKYGLDAPSHTVIVTAGAQPPATFIFGTVKDGARTQLYTKTLEQEAIFQLVPNAIEVLKQTPATLEDKTISQFPISAVAAMSFTIPSGATILVQKKRSPGDGGASGPETWSQLSPKSGEGKTWKIGGLMHNLANLRGTKVVGSPTDLKPYGLDAPKHTVKVQNAVGQALVELAIGSEEGANLYVKAANDARVFEVEKYKLSDLPEGPDDLLTVGVDGGAGE